MKNELPFKTELEEKVDQALGEFNEHPIIAKLRQEKAAMVLKKRQTAAAALAALRKEEEAIIPGLIETMEEKEGKLKKAQDARNAATAEFRAAKMELLSASHDIENRISQQASVLLETSDPAIIKAIEFFKERLQFLRSPGRVTRTASGAVLNVIKWEKKVTTSSNYEAILTCIDYCRKAIAQLEQMKLEPVCDMQKIEVLKHSIPSIDRYTDYEAERSIEKVNTNPRLLLPSDSEMDWRTKKILEKGDRLLKKQR